MTGVLFYVSRDPWSARWTRFAVALAIALLLAAVAIYADGGVPIPNECTEAFLRSMWGDWWEWHWWASGCWMLPGGGS